ncbi:molybdopterin molybdotransferase MoeA [Akkermansiaceae bacterium]|nr:molybdopterin molybdotransferase MoeA [Akkermansiaceae bacterium]MDB4143208.1 molybdopterin molybdotransferase MoeA [Akkermansiaceae bacterium]MDB4274457.1 molybdopterin molybdotransferase MoeA [Akkermansiaceae bacterium]MDB4295386.1 molybdopterin molybdotransferase MoeA [Akkermansiaceae bacterium]MDB4467447.1 molybdopterin molybdotransferase MoeA [Akkermansiaceae bacterium]
MTLITPAEAEALILSSIAPLSTERVSLERSLGRVLREPILADRSFPPFDRVTMDGIAFFKSDLNELRLHGLHAAGDPEPAELPAGSCWQIMTGASLPSDCDTVVPYEEVEIGETHAKINCEVVPGRFIHRKESDASPGDLLVPAGTRIGPAQLGLAASVGAIELTVTRLPKITILGTGDELVPPEETPLPHQLRQSNGLTLRAAVEEWGAAEITLAHLADDLASTTSGIAEALEKSDLVILSGGISKGKKDYVRPALESLIGPPLFHGVAQRPGKPLAYWPGVAALPGNPNSTLTTFHRYLVPTLQALVGLPQKVTSLLPLETPQQAHDFLTIYLPASLNEKGKLHVLSPQNSGDFVTPLTAQGIVEIAPGTQAVTCGKYRLY